MQPDDIRFSYFLGGVGLRRRRIIIPVRQVDIPFHVPPESGVKIPVIRMDPLEQDAQFDTGFRGNPAQQRGLILDGVRNDIQ